MNELKKCPYCNELIKIDAKKCKFCKKWIDKIQEDLNEFKKCPYCFEDIHLNAKKCRYCNSNINNLTPETSPEMRNNLKHYSEHVEMLCLECGYKGPMGVIKEIKKFDLPWWAVVLLILCGVGWLILLVLGILSGFYVSYLCECPNCGCNIISKN